MLTVKAAAKRAEVGEATVWRMLADGRLKKYRRAGDRRVLPGSEGGRRAVSVPAA